MNYEVEVFRSQFPVVKDFVYNATYYSVLYRLEQEHKTKSNFVVRTMNAHAMQAALSWCMVFGTNDNPIHWKKLSHKDNNDFKLWFRDGLLRHVGISEESWKEYWNKVIRFRNEYIAHRELIVDAPVPNFTTALTVSFYYDEWVREVISPDIFDEPPLEKSAEEIDNSSNQILKEIFNYVKEHNERSGEFV